MPSLSRCDVYITASSCLLLAHSYAGLSGQTAVEEKHRFNTDIRCVIQTERRQWNRQSETIISGTMENLTDSPLELEADPSLYLSSRTSSEMRDRFWAPVDLLHDRPIGTDVNHDVGGVGVSIKPRPIHLQFKNKEDKIDFRIDAQHLLWAKEISSVWPSSALFSTVKSDHYDLQLVLETDNGRVESPKVQLSIDASKPPKQQIGSLR